MKNIIQGDTYTFSKIWQNNSGGTYVGTGTFTFIGDNGSTFVDNVAGTDAGDGTWTYRAETVGWDEGAIIGWLRMAGEDGTYTNIRTNEFKIVSSAEDQSTYIYTDELSRYLENIEDYFDGNEDERVLEAKKLVDAGLESMGYKLPVVKNDDGYYDQPLRDWNAWGAIYRIINAHESTKRDGDEIAWHDKFKEYAKEYMEAYRKRKYTLSQVTSIADSGISPSTKTVGTLPGALITNWEGYGEGYRGADYPRTWQVEITGTGTSNGLSECIYKWTSNNGETWGTNGTTSSSWQGLGDEVYVRFSMGTSSAGTENLFNIGDKWTFETHPRANVQAGNKIAKSY